MPNGNNACDPEVLKLRRRSYMYMLGMEVDGESQLYYNMHECYQRVADYYHVSNMRVQMKFNELVRML